MKRLWCWLVILMFPIAGKAQCNLCRSFSYGDTLLHSTQKTVRTASFASKTLIKPTTVPADLYTKNFGFFCRQELKMHQAHVPLSFRLGSMDYCDMLEQKGGCSAK